MPSYDKNPARNIFSLLDEGMSLSLPVIANDLSLFSARAPSFGDDTSLTRSPGIVSDFDALLALGLTERFGHGTSLGLTSVSSHTTNTLDWRSSLHALTTAYSTNTSWFNSTTSTEVISSTLTSQDTVDNLRETGARLCVVDLHQWRQQFKSVSFYKVKI